MRWDAGSVRIRHRDFRCRWKTPPNEHAEAFEYFYVLFGEGIAKVGDSIADIKQGSYFVVAPGQTHQVVNTGSTKLYVLTTMVPDEKFSDLIKSGPEASLDEEDIRILSATADSAIAHRQSLPA